MYLYIFRHTNVVDIFTHYTLYIHTHTHTHTHSLSLTQTHTNHSRSAMYSLRTSRYHCFMKIKPFIFNIHLIVSHRCFHFSSETNSKGLSYFNWCGSCEARNRDARPGASAAHGSRPPCAPPRCIGPPTAQEARVCCLFIFNPNPYPNPTPNPNRNPKPNPFPNQKFFCKWKDFFLLPQSEIYIHH